ISLSPSRGSAMRLLSCLLCIPLLVAFTRADDPKPAAQPAGQWVTVKGTVVFPGKVYPKQMPLNVGIVGQFACLNGKPPLNNAINVNQKNGGIENVVVWLRPDNKTTPKAAFKANEINPADAKRKPANVEIDQPCCMFTPRIVAARVGDTIVVKNSAPFNHNFFW